MARSERDGDGGNQLDGGGRCRRGRKRWRRLTAPRLDSFDEGVADVEAELTAASARAQTEGVDGDHGSGGGCLRLDLGLGFGEREQVRGREGERGVGVLFIHAMEGGTGRGARGWRGRHGTAAWRQCRCRHGVDDTFAKTPLHCFPFSDFSFSFKTSSFSYLFEALKQFYKIWKILYSKYITFRCCQKSFSPFGKYFMCNLF